MPDKDVAKPPLSLTQRETTTTTTILNMEHRCDAKDVALYRGNVVPCGVHICVPSIVYTVEPALALFPHNNNDNTVQEQGYSNQL